MTGFTDSSNFPTTLGAFDTSFNGRDGFVTKLNATGSTLVYSTFLGGGGGHAIAVDSVGNAYMTGDTGSSTLATPGAFQTTFNSGDFDAFVTKLNATGALLYSTYLGGSDSDGGQGIALDALANPNAYVSGVTESADFPTTAGAFDTTFGGFQDGFVAKVIDVVLPPPPTVAKVTGGGSITVPGGVGTFSFIVQRKTTTGPISGNLQYVNHASRVKVHSVTFTTLVAAGNAATFGGTCTINGAPCTFTVEVTDEGEPGTDETFTISVSAGPPEGGTLRSGNIQIHE